MTENIDVIANVISALVTIALIPFAIFFYYEFKDLRASQQKLADQLALVSQTLASMEWLDHFRSEQIIKNHDYDKQLTELKVQIALLS